MSFLKEIIEEREEEIELNNIEKELIEAEEFLLSIKRQLDEAVMDFGDMEEGKIFDEAQRRLAAAKNAFGIVNRLRNPEERKTHRSRLAGYMNRLRALLGRLVQKFTKEET